jgi:hypothetical protein
LVDYPANSLASLPRSAAAVETDTIQITATVTTHAGALPDGDIAGRRRY